MTTPTYRVRCLSMCVGTVLASTCVRATVQAAFNEQIPYTPFYAAVVLTTLYCGFTWGIASTTLSAFSASFWLTPFGKPLIEEPTDLIGLLLFLSVCLLLVWIADRSRTNLLSAQQSVAERQELLLREHAARAKAEEASRAKDTLLASVSHELRTPLQSILGWSQLLRTERLDANEAALALESIERSGKIQVQLINDLLDMSRIATGKLTLNIQVVYLAELVDAAIQTVLPAAQSKRVEILRNIDRAAGPVMGDVDRLHQAIWNLLTNAVKFTPERGKVTVSLIQHDEQLELTIRDTGEGIEAASLPYVFDRFFQSQTGLRKGGLGLGLAIVKEIVEMHGGSMAAASGGAGCGAAFTIRLAQTNIAALQTPGTEPSEESGQAEESLAGIQVLVVEDDAEAARLIRCTLERYGAAVLTAGSADQAIELLRRQSPQVVLSDIGLPGEDGFSLI